ncbi:MAG: leucyl/phenylalanyl-tRNA--protein transferase [Methylococcales bacterium]|nr:leucyl/phenylalanyl-tRNA--protein transferase [Methylococcales bacterium]
MQLTVLNPHNPDQKFPPLQKALREPDGLLAIGGCLSKKRLLTAYRQGVFPWYNPGEPILWWSPDPRLVLFTDQVIISKSLKKTLNKNVFTVTFDHAFSDVIDACAKPRDGSSGTWISKDIKNAYVSLHHSGFAHSAEAWLNGELVGGLYGVALGRVFFGESMFHTRTDASKVAFATLVMQLKAWDYQLIDCQVHTQHLASFGAASCGRSEFVKLLDDFCDVPPHPLAWK